MERHSSWKVVISVAFLSVSVLLLFVALPSKHSDIINLASASKGQKTAHSIDMLNKKANDTVASASGSRNSRSAFSVKGTDVRKIDEYIAGVTAKIPPEERDRRITELARHLFYRNYAKDKAANLLESLIIDSVSRGDEIYKDAVELLREIYRDEGNEEGYNRLLANIPDSYPQKQEIAAALDYSPGGTIQRLEKEVEKDAMDIQARYGLAVAYDSLGLPWKAAEELNNALNISEEPFLYAKLANIYQTLGRQDLAREAFANAARLDPAYGSAAMY